MAEGSFNKLQIVPAATIGQCTVGVDLTFASHPAASQEGECQIL